MAKWFGKIGYGHFKEGSPGVWTGEITEKKYFGDVLQNSRRLVPGTEANADLVTDNSISIVADPYALEHFFAITYVEWAGTLWTVSKVEVQSPRLILRLGGVYTGTPPSTSPDSGGGSRD